MAKAPQNEQQPTEASRIAALEEWSQSTAEYLSALEGRVSNLESAVAEFNDALHANGGSDLDDRLTVLEAAMKDNAHVSRAPAESAPIDGDVFARIKRLEQHAGIKQS